ncbi:NADPH-dependent F420 reductase [Methanococcus voltae]|uniref:NADPH-dependent F420 reductase n=1 Tax=Methanococcus voltae (strain ATCC BAA-1334 / A3) TaxID=456320 RepID=D7DUG5_METV3|nr:NADPH-dependent F420 reductase [Methanococcus voltae]MCS3900575.1 NADPH-dependent F420 reductase [Methanococcus voltae]
MKVAILGGTGDQGLGLAMRFAMNEANEVIIGSRKEEKAIEAAKEAMERLSTVQSKDTKNISINAMTNLDAAKEADVVLLSLPFEYTISTLKDLKDALKGKIVVSLMVPLASAFGDKPTRVITCPQGSVAEMVQAYLPESTVVSGFHNVCHKCLCDLENPINCDVLIAGDDKEANKTVVELANTINGVNGIDCGKLEISRYIEQITPLLVQLNIKYKAKGTGLRITGLEGKL